MSKAEELIRSFYECVHYSFIKRGRATTHEEEVEAVQPVFTAARMLDDLDLDQATAEQIRHEVNAAHRAVFGEPKIS